VDHEIDVHHLRIDRHARYALLGERAAPSEVWFALHGYGQLAHRFLRYLRRLDDGSRLLVAPEGLHRYYVDHAARKVGSTWMTSEDRLTDIDDYVAWLDRLYDAVFETVRREDVVVVALGFSQGVQTLCRWLAFGAAAIDTAILWGASVPPDLDLEVHASRLSRARLFLVGGDEDSIFAPDVMASVGDRLRSAGLPSRSVGFHGGHRLDPSTLERLAAEIASGGRSSAS
jgi:predicted esterase